MVETTTYYLHGYTKLFNSIATESRDDLRLKIENSLAKPYGAE
jgi:hypothetical protein